MYEKSISFFCFFKKSREMFRRFGTKKNQKTNLDETLLECVFPLGMDVYCFGTYIENT